MGNNESYAQVSKPIDTGDEQIQDDLTYVFHTTDEDTPDRVVHDTNTDYPLWPYAVTSSGRLLAERRIFKEPVDCNEIFQLLRPGDAVEFLKPGKKFHWALYVGEDTFIHLKQKEIVKASSQDFASDIDLKARFADDIYKMKCLPIVQILNNAQAQVGKPLIWNCSESFVMWCRTGKSEFTLQETKIQNLDSSTPKNSKGKYMLELHTPDETVMRRFFTLSELIDFRRNTEKFGKDFLLTNPNAYNLR